jgi:Protein of unknown function (DUF1579)
MVPAVPFLFSFREGLMKTRIFVAHLLLLTLCGAVALADDKADGKKNLMKEYFEKFGQPGPEHKLLQPLVGHWQAKMRCWMDPNEAPKVSEGEVVRKAIFDGRFIAEEVTGEIMNHPFKGIGLMGYDRAKKKFVASWVDNMDTAIRECHGTYDETNKTWTFKHEGTCPITNKHVTMRDTLRIVSDNEQQMDMYRQLGDEKEFKTMEITLKRQNVGKGQ